MTIITAIIVTIIVIFIIITNIFFESNSRDVGKSRSVLRTRVGHVSQVLESLPQGFKSDFNPFTPVGAHGATYRFYSV